MEKHGCKGRCVFRLIEEGLPCFWELDVIQPKERDLTCANSLVHVHTQSLLGRSAWVFQAGSESAEVNLPVDPFTVLWVLDQKEV